MKARIIKKTAIAFSVFALFFLVGCAQNMDSADMGNSMNSMEEKSMTEMQDEGKTDSMETMNAMEKETSMKETSEKEMSGMDKMMK